MALSANSSPAKALTCIKNRIYNRILGDNTCAMLSHSWHVVTDVYLEGSLAEKVRYLACDSRGNTISFELRSRSRCLNISKGLVKSRLVKLTRVHFSSHLVTNSSVESPRIAVIVNHHANYCDQLGQLCKKSNPYWIWLRITLAQSSFLWIKFPMVAPL